MLRLKRAVAASTAMALALFHFGATAQAQTCAWTSEVNAAADAYNDAYIKYNEWSWKDQYFEWTDEYVTMYAAFSTKYAACQGSQNANMGDVVDCQEGAQLEFDLDVSERRAELAFEVSSAEYTMNVALGEYNALLALPRCDAP